MFLPVMPRKLTTCSGPVSTAVTQTFPLELLGMLGRVRLTRGLHGTGKYHAAAVVVVGVVLFLRNNVGVFAMQGDRAPNVAMQGERAPNVAMQGERAPIVSCGDDLLISAIA